MKVISLGWGVQSWTLAAMSALGELEPVDVAIHADTTWERQATYEFVQQWTSWLEDHGVRVVTVNDEPQAQKVMNDEPDIPAFAKKATPIVPLRNDNFKIVIPAYTTYEKDIWLVDYDEDGQGELAEVGRQKYKAHLAGDNSGMLRRQCTYRWKIQPMRRWLRSQGVTQAEQWLGITRDEIERAKDSDVKWIIHRFPLLEKSMTRQDCIIWLRSHSLPVPPKSSCVFCPYHRRATWVEMKNADGPDWKTAVEVDEAIRNKRPGYVAYVHPDRIPLIELKTAADFGATQLSFVDTSNAECDSGFCFL